MEERNVAPLELIVGEAGGEIHNADIPVRWCISPELILEMEENGAKDIHIVLVSTQFSENGYDYREMDRQLIPIGELMTYLRFSRAGKCHIMAWLIDGHMSRNFLYSEIMTKEYSRYKTTLYDESGRMYKIRDCLTDPIKMEVEIPTNVFGKEPSPWLKWYANLWHNSKNRPPDECSYRKRLILAFTLKWIPVLIFYFGVLIINTCVVLFMALMGYPQNVRWKTAWRPFKYPTFSYVLKEKHFPPLEYDNQCIKWRTMKAVTNVRWYEDINDKGELYYKTAHKHVDTEFPYLWSIAFCIPLVLIFIVGVGGFLFTSFFGVSAIGYGIGLMGSVFFLDLAMPYMLKSDLWVAELVVFLKNKKRKMMFVKAEDAPALKDKYEDTIFDLPIMKAALIICAGSLLIGFVSIAGWKLLLMLVLPSIVVFGVMLGVFYVITKYTGSKVHLSVKDNDLEKVADLVCPRNLAREPLPTAVDSIPRRQKTIRLWVKDVKNKVCKPMQY